MKQLIFSIITLILWGVTTWLWIPVMTEFLGPLNLFVHIVGALMYGALLGLFALLVLFQQQRFAVWKVMTWIIVIATIVMLAISFS